MTEVTQTLERPDLEVPDTPAKPKVANKPARLGQPLAEKPAPQPKAESEPKAQGYKRLVDQAKRLRRSGPASFVAAADRFAGAADSVEPGRDRSFALAQRAALLLKAEQAQEAVDTLMSERDWAHHERPAIETLIRAAVRAGAVTPFRWLATRPSSGHVADPAILDRGLGMAIHHSQLELGRELVELAAELAPGSPLVPYLTGRLCDKEKDVDGALDAYLAAAQAGSTEGSCYRRLTSLLVKLEREEEAAEWARRGIDANLDATTRQQLEKLLARHSGASPGERREALAKIVALYPRQGEATIERIGKLPIAATKAAHAGALTVALGQRLEASCLFLRDARESRALDVELPFAPRRLLAHPGKELCLALADMGDGVETPATIVATDGPARPFQLHSTPHRALALTDRCLFAYRDGTIESRSWSGEQQWKTRFGERREFAYWLAGSDERLLASYLDGIYEVGASDGALKGPMLTAHHPEEGGEPGRRDAVWVKGLGTIGERGFALVRDGFHEVQADMRLQQLEEIGPEAPADRMVADSRGQLVALAGKGSFRLVGLDGRLSAPIASPVRRRGIERMDGGRIATYVDRELSILDATGTETHRFDAAGSIRSVQAVAKDELVVVAGREALRVTLAG